MAIRARICEIVLYSENWDIDLIKDKCILIAKNYYISPLHQFDIKENKTGDNFISGDLGEVIEEDFGDIEDYKKNIEEELENFEDIEDSEEIEDIEDIEDFEEIEDIEDFGESKYKKPHYHVILEFSNARYFSSIAKEFNIGENLVNKVYNRISALRYLCHLDNENKYHYLVDEVVSNCDYETEIEQKKKKDVSEYLVEITQYIIMNNEVNFRDLVLYYSTFKDSEYIKCLSGKAYYFNTLLRSNSVTKKSIDKKVLAKIAYND